MFGLDVLSETAEEYGVLGESRRTLGFLAHCLNKKKAFEDGGGDTRALWCGCFSSQFLKPDYALALLFKNQSEKHQTQSHTETCFLLLQCTSKKGQGHLEQSSLLELSCRVSKCSPIYAQKSNVEGLL